MSDKFYVVAWRSLRTNAMGYREELLTFNQCSVECNDLNEVHRYKYYFPLDYALLSKEAWEEFQNEFSE